MYDSSGDSLLTESISTCSDSTQKQIQVHQELQHINDLTNAVMKENTQLRAQVQQATSVTSEIEKLNKQNVLLTSQLRKLSNEKNDLNHRLEISLKAKDEAEKKMENEKKNAMITIKNERDRNVSDQLNTENNCQIKMSHLYSELEKLQDYSNQTNLAKKVLENQIEKILNSATHFFKTKFNSVDDLISCFEHASNIIPTDNFNYAQQYPPMKQPPYINQPVDTQCDDAIKKKLKKNKGKIKSLQEEVAQLKRELIRSEKENERLTNNEKLINQEYINKMELLRGDNETKYCEQEREIQTLNKKVKSLEEELKKRKKQLQKVASELESQKMQNLISNNQYGQYDAKPKLSPSSNPYLKKENTLRSVQLENANAELVQQNEDQRNTIQKLNQQIEELQYLKERDEKIKEQLKIDKQKSINDYESLKMLQQETVKEADSLRAALQSKDDDERLNQQKRYIRQLKMDVQSHQKTIDALQAENENLKIEREKYAKANNEINLKAEEIKQALASTNVENQSLKDEIQYLKIEMKRNTKTVDDFVSLDSFVCCEFPLELREKIRTIIDNSLLSVNSKIKCSYQEIASYYARIVKEVNNELNENLIECQRVSNELKNLVVNLSLALELPPRIDITNTLYLVEETKRVKDQLRDCQRANREQDEIIRGINTSMYPNGCDINNNKYGNYNPCIIYQIEEINHKLCQVTQDLEAEKKRSSKYKKALHEEKQKNEMEKLGNEKEISKKDQENSLLNMDLKQAQQLNDELRKNCNQMKCELMTLKQDNDSLKKKYEERIDQLHSRYSSEKTKLETQIQGIITENNQHIQTHMISHKDQESVISALNNTIAAQKKMIEAKNEEIERLEKEADKKVSKIKTSFDYEKEQMIDSYTNTIKQLQAQCEKHRDDLSHLTDQISQSKKKNDKLQKKNRKLELTLAEKKMAIEKISDAKTRENKLFDCNSKATIAAIESKFTDQVNEMKRKLESEKKKIFSIAAEEMHDYFDASENLDERQFRRIMKQASEDIHKLRENEATIKRMLSSTNCDSAIEAVAHILIKK